LNAHCENLSMRTLREVVYESRYWIKDFIFYTLTFASACSVFMCFCTVFVKTVQRINNHWPKILGKKDKRTSKRGLFLLFHWYVQWKTRMYHKNFFWLSSVLSGYSENTRKVCKLLLRIREKYLAVFREYMESI